jgi:DNA polymerase-3 subunit delta'
LSVSSLDELQGLIGAKKAASRYSELTSGVHAVLFYGIRGSGKMQLARILAKRWLSGGNAESQSAIAFDNGRNADFLHVQPMGPSRIIRDIQMTQSKAPLPPEFKGPNVLDFLRTPPLISACKVVLIEDADRMNQAAANVILKSLEEPHPYARFVLTSQAVGALPATILSRCSAVACEVPAGDQSDPLWLLAEGAPGRYTEISADEGIYQAIWQFAESLGRRNFTEALVASESLKNLCDTYQKQNEQNARAAQSDVLELLAIALRHQYPDWTQARVATIEAHRRIIGNGNSGLVFDALMMKLLNRKAR